MRRASGPFALPGAVAVVTGASTGLGRRLALDLAEGGAVVTAIARRADLLDATVATMRRASPASGSVTCDVTDLDTFVGVLASVESQRGRIDLLVNAAGRPEPADATVGAYRELMAVNFFAPVAGTLAVLPGMRARHHGVVLNVTSDAGRSPIPGEPAYGASKAALTAFTESMAYRAAPDGVRLHLLYPGWVPTALTLRPDGPSTRPPRLVRRSEEQVARVALRGLGRARVDLDATWAARFGPVAKVLAPGLYRRAVLRSAPR